MPSPIIASSRVSLLQSWAASRTLQSWGSWRPSSGAGTGDFGSGWGGAGAGTGPRRPKQQQEEEFYGLVRGCWGLGLGMGRPAAVGRAASGHWLKA
jgi:hypothetical protein